MTDGLISEAVIETARERVFCRPFNDSIREFAEREPELHCAVGRFAVNAVGDNEGVAYEVQDAAHRAVWQAVLLALESYRLAHYRLWSDSELGHLLRRLDPTLAETTPKILKPPPDEICGPPDGSGVTP